MILLEFAGVDEPGVIVTTSFQAKTPDVILLTRPGSVTPDVVPAEFPTRTPARWGAQEAPWLKTIATQLRFPDVRS